MDPRFSNYPRANMGGGAAFGQRPPGAHFDFISEAFNIIRSDLGTWVVVSLITLVITYAVSIPLTIVGAIINGTASAANPYAGFSAVGAVYQIVSSALTYSVSLFLLVGQGMMGIRAARGERPQIGEMFAPLRLFLPVFLTSLVVSVLVLFGLVFLVIPGIVAAGLFVLAPFAAYDQNLQPGDALRWSMQNCKPYLWAIALLGFCASFMSGIGICLCGVGLLFTQPIFGIVLGLTYSTFRAPAPAPFMPYPPSGPVETPGYGVPPAPQGTESPAPSYGAPSAPVAPPETSSPIIESPSISESPSMLDSPGAPEPPSDEERPPAPPSPGL